MTSIFSEVGFSLHRNTSITIALIYIYVYIYAWFEKTETLLLSLS